jgi:hypothetical protein
MVLIGKISSMFLYRLKVRWDYLETTSNAWSNGPYASALRLVRMFEHIYVRSCNEASHIVDMSCCPSVEIPSPTDLTFSLSIKPSFAPTTMTSRPTLPMLSQCTVNAP